MTHFMANDRYKNNFKWDNGEHSVVVFGPSQHCWWILLPGLALTKFCTSEDAKNYAIDCQGIK